MGSTKRSRPFQSRWKPALNTFEIAATRARKLPADVLVGLRTSLAGSIDALGQEGASATAWQDLCVACIMARRIEMHGVVKGLAALIGDALRVLNDVHKRSLVDGHWHFSVPSEDELAVQQAVFTRKGCDRIMRYAFELARTRTAKKVTSATKSNGIIFSMPYWDERFAAMAAEYPDIATDQFHIDILTARFVTNPDRFDVVVGSNLFGDILSDLGPAIAGSIGIAASANINPERDHPSMF